MSIDETALAALETLAQGATEGPYGELFGLIGPKHGGTVCQTFSRHDEAFDNHTANTAYIAAASPDVVLALIAALRAARGDSARLDWLETRRYSPICWKVLPPSSTNDNPWSIGSDNGPMDDLAEGDTLRDCVDDGMRRELEASDANA